MQNQGFAISENNLRLLERIARGDEKAFNELFKLYRNRLYSYLLKATKSKTIAEEATLDIFMKIWNGRDMLYDIENFDAFLFRVMHNKAIDYLRMAQKSRLQQMDIWADLENLALAAASDEKLLKAETEQAIQYAVKQLSPQRQEAFRLSREEYLTYDQIAQRMNISRNTVRNHVSAALDFIRGNLDKGMDISTILLLTVKMY